MVLIYFNALEKIVKDSFTAVKDCTTDSATTSPIIVGGMAIQVHCYQDQDLLRSTSDLDLLYLPRIESFQQFQDGEGGKILRAIRKSGYQVQLKKSRANYEVKVMDGQGNKAKQLFFIHFDCLSDELFAKTGYISQREVENAIFHEQGEFAGLYVKRLEDILPHKVKRVRGKIQAGAQSNPLFGTLYQQAERMLWKNLAPLATKEWCNQIADMQNSFPSDEKSHSPVYDVNKDLYDICLLARKIESSPGMFNRSYYLNSVREINSI